jgi:hypothetical protein
VNVVPFRKTKVLLLALHISVNAKAGVLISTYSLSLSIFYLTFYVLA